MYTIYMKFIITIIYNILYACIKYFNAFILNILHVLTHISTYSLIGLVVYLFEYVKIYLLCQQKK